MLNYQRVFQLLGILLLWMGQRNPDHQLIDGLSVYRMIYRVSAILLVVQDFATIHSIMMFFFPTYWDPWTTTQPKSRQKKMAAIAKPVLKNVNHAREKVGSLVLHQDLFGGRMWYAWSNPSKISPWSSRDFMYFKWSSISIGGYVCWCRV